MAQGKAGPRSEFARLFGLNLARAREQAGLSQEELGFQASLHRTAVGQLERGERAPRLDSAVRLASTLELPIGTLLRGISWKPPKLEIGSFHFSENDEI